MPITSIHICSKRNGSTQIESEGNSIWVLNAGGTGAPRMLGRSGKALSGFNGATSLRGVVTYFVARGGHCISRATLTVLPAFIAVACAFASSASAETLIRCPDWKQLVAVNEGRAVLRKAAPDADFDALIKAAASAKAASNSASTPAPNRKAKQTPIPVPPTTCTHTVVVGDTLSKIAKSRLGDPKRWVELQKLNAVALKGKTVLRIGQILSLPCVSGAAAHNTNQPIKPAPAPVPVWSARGGETLTTVLTRWSKGAGVKLIIDTRDDWIISVPVQIKGSFKSAVDELIEGLSTTGATPPVRIFSNNILKLG